MLPKAASKPESIMLYCVSLLLSILLWLQVMTQAQPTSRKELLIALHTTNVSSALLVTQIPDGVTVTLEGPEALLERIEPSQLVATVDLKSAKAGIQNIRVQLPEVREPLLISAKRPTVPVALEEMVETSKKVEIQLKGTLNPDLRFLGATAQPAFVNVSGPASEVARIARVRALSDLTLVKPGLIQLSSLEILDKDNVPLTMVKPDPLTVSVLPRLDVAPTTRNVLITPTWQGQPAFGYIVKSYKITPNSVPLSGPSELLASLGTVNTLPINLEGIKESKNFTIRLNIPEGVSPADLKPILIEVTVQRGKQ